MTREQVLILDFGSQYTQLIARRVRESRIYSKIISYKTSAKEIEKLKPKGLILSGGPASVTDKGSPLPDKKIFKLGIPILGICYGVQVMAQILGGRIKKATEREYGRAELFIDENKDIFFGLPANITCWMSHGDLIQKLPPGFTSIGHTLNSPVAAVRSRNAKFFGVQFHPEVIHTSKGGQIVNNFLYRVCRCVGRWRIESFIAESVKQIKESAGKKGKVICGVSGGVDSAVVALLINKAIGDRLRCIFVNNGLLRKNEAQQVRKMFQESKVNLDFIDASERFLKRLKGVVDPEDKRKIIGNEFIRVFEERAKKFKGAEFLAQGTLYPDVIESIPAHGGPTAKIKSHHNVGGLPLKMKLKLIEPLRELFKDEVRAIGKKLGLPENFIYRQPFPGPGLAIRIVGGVTKENLNILREADERIIEEIKKADLYNSVWQAFAVLLPIKSVGVMGDERTYENVIAIRCVTSADGMTADWAKLSHEILGIMSSRIINEVKGVNRVVYDISSKPPATIEWE